MQKLILALFIITAASPLFGKQIRVNENGKSIQQAVFESMIGDTITIASGHYYPGEININKQLTILGENFPVLEAKQPGEIFLVTANRVTIKWITFENVTRSFIKDYAAIKLENVTDCLIENNKLINNFFGIYLAKSSGCEIKDNYITSNGEQESNSGNGIHLWSSRDNNIHNNIISGHRDGIYLEFAKHCLVSGNLSKSSLRYGLHFMFSDSCKYSKNTFEHNGAGVAVMYSRQIHMENNVFKNNSGAASFGILLKDIRDSRIINNTITNNSIGIFIEGSSRLIVKHNTFSRNGWALKLMANSMDNRFSRNNFIANTFDITTNSRKNFNTIDSNYWGNYAGYDINKDGFGELPYHPVSLFSYVVAQNPPLLILLHSFFMNLLDLAERIIPVLTPAELIDKHPSMKFIV